MFQLLQDALVEVVRHSSFPCKLVTAWLNDAESDEAFRAGDDRFLARPRLPPQHTLGFRACPVLSSSGTIERSVGLNRAAARISQLGNSRVGTFFAASPSLALSTLAISSIDINPPDTAMKRSPFAAGSVIA